MAALSIFDPVIAILKSDTNPIVYFLSELLYGESGLPNNSMIFWLTGIHSSFLDNAPSYLIFFNAMGGDPIQLMTELGGTLMAISCGAVFMGANTYIGNGPNFMVKSIAEEQGIEMPSFMGYIFKYTIPILVPFLIGVSWLFF